MSLTFTLAEFHCGGSFGIKRAGSRWISIVRTRGSHDVMMPVHGATRRRVTDASLFIIRGRRVLHLRSNDTDPVPSSHSTSKRIGSDRIWRDRRRRWELAMATQDRITRRRKHRAERRRVQSTSPQRSVLHAALRSSDDSLQSPQTMPHLSGRLARWIEKMSSSLAERIRADPAYSARRCPSRRPRFAAGGVLAWGPPLRSSGHVSLSATTHRRARSRAVGGELHIS